MPSTEESGDSSSETSQSSVGNKGGRKAEPKRSKKQGGKRAASASKVKPKPPAKKREKKTPAPARMPPNTPMVKQLAKTPVKRGRDATDADAPNPEIPPATPPRERKPTIQRRRAVLLWLALRHNNKWVSFHCLQAHPKRTRTRTAVP